MRSTECVVIHFFASHSGKRVNLGTDNGLRFDLCLDSNKRRFKEIDLDLIVQQKNSFYYVFIDLSAAQQRLELVSGEFLVCRFVQTMSNRKRQKINDQVVQINAELQNIKFYSYRTPLSFMAASHKLKHVLYSCIFFLKSSLNFPVKRMKYSTYLNSSTLKILIG